MNSSPRPLVTVVTPVYNAEEFLPECIESVLRQSYQNWEYVIVNNRSTDRSLEIAERYARQDARVRIHNNDRFLSSIQNQDYAIKQVSPASTYCKVVHADDWLYPRCIEEMVAVAEAHLTVGIVGAYRLDGMQVTLDGLPYDTALFSGREICRRYLLEGFYVFGSPTSLLIRAELIRERAQFYDDSRPWTDVEACCELLQEHDFGFVHQVLTYSRRHAGASSFNAGRFEGYRITELGVLIRFGRIFLSADEYERRLQFLLGNYYRFLVRSALRRKERAFWDIHRRGIRTIGLRLSPLKLFEASAGMALSALTRPFKILASVVQSRQG